MSSYEQEVEDFAVHLYKLNKPWAEPYNYSIEYFGQYDRCEEEVYNWQEYEQQSREAVEYFYERIQVK